MVAPSPAAGMAAIENHGVVVGFDLATEEKECFSHNVVAVVVAGIYGNDGAVCFVCWIVRIGVGDECAMTGVVKDYGVARFGLFD